MAPSLQPSVRLEPSRHCSFTYMELLDCWPTALAGSNLLNFHYLNGVSTGAMTGSHITVCNKTTQLNVSKRMPSYSCLISRHALTEII